MLHELSTKGTRLSLLNFFDQSTQGSFSHLPRQIDVFLFNTFIAQAVMLHDVTSPQKTTAYQWAAACFHTP